MEILSGIIGVIVLSYLIAHHVVNNNLIEQQRKMIDEQKKHIEHHVSLGEIKNKSIERKTKNYDEQKRINGEQQRHIEFLTNSIQQLQEFQGRGYKVIPVESLVEDLEELNYDEFIDYLERLSIQDLSVIRQVMNNTK